MNKHHDKKHGQEVNKKPLDAIDNMFSALDLESSGYIKKDDLLATFARHGILEDDLRIKEAVQALNKIVDAKISAENFREIVSQNITLIEKSMTGRLIIPDFSNFHSFIKNIYNRTILNKEGNVSSNIPELASVDPEQYAISVCTVDGQQLNIGPHDKSFIARAICTPINYCAASDNLGEEEIHFYKHNRRIADRQRRRRR